jgi:hypothetical protein
VDNLAKGIRAQDIHTGLQDVNLGAFAVDTANLRLVAMAERLAIHVRGTDVIDDFERFKYMASQLGIDPVGLPEVLRVLQELDWARVIGSGASRTVEEKVPYFTSVFATGGEHLTTLGPTSLEQSILEATDLLALTPMPLESVSKKLGLSKQEATRMLDLGRSGGIIDVYQSEDSGESILYSPLFWSENLKKLEQVGRLLRTYGAATVADELEHVRQYQGSPVDPSTFSTGGVMKGAKAILRDAVHRGLLLAPSVSSMAGMKHFLFLPTVETEPGSRVLLEKAMAVLSSVRYGQHFGTITRVFDPSLIINKLLTSPQHQIGSHSEIPRQYATLVGRGMGRILQDISHPGRAFFRLNPSKENLAALRLALDLLSKGQKVEGRGLDEAATATLFGTGQYQESLQVLPRVRRGTKMSGETASFYFDKLLDKVRE